MPPVTVVVGGQSFRIVSTMPEEDLRRLAALVDERLPATQRQTAQAFLLAAVRLAHELEEAVAARKAVEAQSRDALRRILMRIDSALGADDPETDESEAEQGPAEDVSRETSSDEVSRET